MQKGETKKKESEDSLWCCKKITKNGKETKEKQLERKKNNRKHMSHATGMAMVTQEGSDSGTG